MRKEWLAACVLALLAGCASGAVRGDGVPARITPAWYVANFPNCIDECEDPARTALWARIRERADLVEALVATIESPRTDLWTRANAILRLGATNQTPAYAYLRERLAALSDDEPDASAWVLALGSGHAPAPDFVYDALAAQLEHGRRADAALVALGGMGTRRAHALVADAAAGHSSAAIRARAAEALAAWRPRPGREETAAADASFERLLAAEDARAALPGQLDDLRAGLALPEPGLRAMAVRALGRLERPELAAQIEAMLTDADAAVRSAAANALAQALSRAGPEEAAGPRAALTRALAAEPDAAAAAWLAESAGRTRHAAGDAAATVAALAPLLERDATRRLGALRGLYFLARQPPARPAVAGAADGLRAAASAPGATAEVVRGRVLAVATLAAAGLHTAASVEAGLADADWTVRREAAVALGALPDEAALPALVERALADAAPQVRVEGLRVHGRRIAPTAGCATIDHAAGDGDAHVALLALDLLGTACAGTDGLETLRRHAAGLAGAGRAWHRPARALVSLAAREPAAAAALLPGFTAHEDFFVRSYAARAAAALGDETVLRRLAGDAHPNVRTAAVQGLRRASGRAADDVYIAQLAGDDSQLLQQATAALEGSGRGDAVAPMLAALDRLTALRRETSRDARRALLRRIQELGDAAAAPRVQPYVHDFDPAIAALAADVVGDWTGTRPEPRPAAPPARPLPTRAELEALSRARMIIEMEDGGEIELRLLAFDAPTNVARFARLARAGYYDGLTLHRVVPNFVVQGGSPHANEYTGDGPFTRDELGRANWRGTVGLSTRGRDTGDAQLYINHIDNVRLDHEYTVWAEVVRGMDVVDRVQEGAVMRRVRVE